jgi:hypothetical protein
MVGNKGQIKAIKQHLESGKSITCMEAFQLYGCTKLPQRIHDLRTKCGMDIITQECVGKTKYKTTCRYAKYSLNN